ncbi:MAG: GNAT family N-acetyltransferase [Bacillota bacterium]
MAAVEDIETLVKFRVEMFREMGKLTGSAAEQDLTATLRKWFRVMMTAERFFAWLAVENGEIIGSSGLVLLLKPPSPDNISGIEGYVMNMYTVPSHRGKGIATALLEECVRFASAAGAGRLSLHASSLGQPVYDKFGFVQSPTEMRMTLG